VARARPVSATCGPNVPPKSARGSSELVQEVEHMQPNRMHINSEIKSRPSPTGLFKSDCPSWDCRHMGQR